MNKISNKSNRQSIHVAEEGAQFYLFSMCNQTHVNRYILDVCGYACSNT